MVWSSHCSILLPHFAFTGAQYTCTSNSMSVSSSCDTNSVLHILLVFSNLIHEKQHFTGFLWHFTMTEDEHIVTYLEVICISMNCLCPVSFKLLGFYIDLQEHVIDCICCKFFFATCRLALRFLRLIEHPVILWTQCIDTFTTSEFYGITTKDFSLR